MQFIVSPFGSHFYEELQKYFLLQKFFNILSCKCANLFYHLTTFA